MKRILIFIFWMSQCSGLMALNDRGTLIKIEKKGVKPSYIYANLSSHDILSALYSDSLLAAAQNTQEIFFESDYVNSDFFCRNQIITGQLELENVDFFRDDIEKDRELISEIGTFYESLSSDKLKLYKSNKATRGTYYHMFRLWAEVHGTKMGYLSNSGDLLNKLIGVIHYAKEKMGDNYLNMIDPIYLSVYYDHINHGLDPSKAVFKYAKRSLRQLDTYLTAEGYTWHNSQEHASYVETLSAKIDEVNSDGNRLFLVSYPCIIGNRNLLEVLTELGYTFSILDDIVGNKNTEFYNEIRDAELKYEPFKVPVYNIQLSLPGVPKAADMEGKTGNLYYLTDNRGIDYVFSVFNKNPSMTGQEVVTGFLLTQVDLPKSTAASAKVKCENGLCIAEYQYLNGNSNCTAAVFCYEDKVLIVAASSSRKMIDVWSAMRPVIASVKFDDRVDISADMKGVEEFDWREFRSEASGFEMDTPTLVTMTSSFDDRVQNGTESNRTFYMHEGDDSGAYSLFITNCSQDGYHDELSGLYKKLSYNACAFSPDSLSTTDLTIDGVPAFLIEYRINGKYSGELRFVRGSSLWRFEFNCLQDMELRVKHMIESIHFLEPRTANIIDLIEFKEGTLKIPSHVSPSIQTLNNDAYLSFPLKYEKMISAQDYTANVIVNHYFLPLQDWYHFSSMKNALTSIIKNRTSIYPKITDPVILDSTENTALVYFQEFPSMSKHFQKIVINENAILLTHVISPCDFNNQSYLNELLDSKLNATSSTDNRMDQKILENWKLSPADLESYTNDVDFFRNINYTHLRDFWNISSLKANVDTTFLKNNCLNYLDSISYIDVTNHYPLFFYLFECPNSSVSVLSTKYALTDNMYLSAAVMSGLLELNSLSAKKAYLNFLKSYIKKELFVQPPIPNASLDLEKFNAYIADLFVLSKSSKLLRNSLLSEYNDVLTNQNRLNEIHPTLHELMRFSLDSFLEDTKKVQGNPDLYDLLIISSSLNILMKLTKIDPYLVQLKRLLKEEVTFYSPELVIIALKHNLTLEEDYLNQLMRKSDGLRLFNLAEKEAINLPVAYPKQIEADVWRGNSHFDEAFASTDFVFEETLDSKWGNESVYYNIYKDKNLKDCWMMTGPFFENEPIWFSETKRICVVEPNSELSRLKRDLALPEVKRILDQSFIRDCQNGRNVSSD